MDITPICERCGKCCNTYSFQMLNRDPDNDPKEIARLIKYHGCEPLRCKQPDGTYVMGIRIPMTCEHLEQTENGKFSCKIHETRPVVCKEYFCEKIIAKAVKELAKGNPI